MANLDKSIVEFPGDPYRDEDIPSKKWSIDEKLRRRKEFEESPLKFITYIRPHLITAPFAPIHYEMEQAFLKCINGDADWSHLAMLVPRHHGKSTLYNGFMLWAICFEKERFILYIGANAKKVAFEVEEIRYDITNNLRLIHLFGNLLESDGASNAKYTGVISRKDTLIFNNGIILMYLGLHIDTGKFPSLTRGLKVRGMRPKLVIWDDPEALDGDAQLTPAMVDRFLNWRFMQLHPGLFVNHREMIAATIPDEVAWANTIKSDKEWRVLFKTCWEEDGYENSPIWPDLWSKEKLLEEKDRLLRAGKLHIWYQEFENTPTNPESAPYQIQWIHYHDFRIGKDKQQVYVEGSIYDHKKNFLKKIKKPVEVIVVVDPAVSSTKDSDFFASVVLATDDTGNHYFLDFIWDKGTDWVILGEAIAKKAKQYHAHTTYIEDFNVQQSLRDWIMKVDPMARVLPRRPIQRDKDSRIMSMQALWKLGKVAIPLESFYTTMSLKNLDGSIKAYSKSLDLSDVFTKHLISYRAGHKTHNLDMLDAAAFAMEINHKAESFVEEEPEPWYAHAFRFSDDVASAEEILEESIFDPIFAD